MAEEGIWETFSFIESLAIVSRSQGVNVEMLVKMPDHKHIFCKFAKLNDDFLKTNIVVEHTWQFPSTSEIQKHNIIIF